jgi:uncharacterized protein with HEPN domain
MPPSEVLKYVLDIEAMIVELEKLLALHKHNYLLFSENFMAVRTAERDLEIIGEAIRKLLQLDANIKITRTKDIIGLRNMLAHAYDAIDPTVLWRILLKDIPHLKTEIEIIKKG